VAALTAHALKEEKEQILAAGCNDFVRKPFREQEIFETMAKYLGLKYVYEGRIEEAGPVKTEVEISLDQFAALPDDLFSQLHDAVIELDEDRILLLIEKIKTIDAHMAKALDNFVKKFELSSLLDLLEKSQRFEQEDSYD
jgi:CheY-like chemotaxis protein